MLHLRDLKQFSNTSSKVPLSHFIQFQFVKKTIVKSHVASLVVFSCMPLFMALSSCSLRHFFVSSFLASAQLKEINTGVLNKILKKLITTCLWHHCSLIYSTRVCDCLDIKICSKRQPYCGGKQPKIGIKRPVVEPGLSKTLPLSGPQWKGVLVWTALCKCKALSWRYFNHSKCFTTISCWFSRHSVIHTELLINIHI